jgi:hypothetical protein
LDGAWTDNNYTPTNKPISCQTWDGSEWIETQTIYKYGKERPYKIIMPTNLTISGGIFAGYIANLVTFDSLQFRELSTDRTHNTIFLTEVLPNDMLSLQSAYNLGVIIYKLV